MRNWRIMRFDSGSVHGSVFGTGLTEAEANEYVELLDKRFDGTGTIFFAECDDN